MIGRNRKVIVPARTGILCIAVTRGVFHNQNICRISIVIWHLQVVCKTRDSCFPISSKTIKSIHHIRHPEICASIGLLVLLGGKRQKKHH